MTNGTALAWSIYEIIHMWTELFGISQKDTQIVGKFLTVNFHWIWFSIRKFEEFSIEWFLFRKATISILSETFQGNFRSNAFEWKVPQVTNGGFKLVSSQPSIFSYFLNLIVERADRIARELDASVKRKTRLGMGWRPRKRFFLLASLVNPTPLPACLTFAFSWRA